MKNEKLITVLKRILEENEYHNKEERQAIQEFLSKSKKGGITTQDVIDLAKSLFGIIELIQSFLE